MPIPSLPYKIDFYFECLVYNDNDIDDETRYFQQEFDLVFVNPLLTVFLQLVESNIWQSQSLGQRSQIEMRCVKSCWPAPSLFFFGNLSTVHLEHLLSCQGEWSLARVLQIHNVLWNVSRQAEVDHPVHQVEGNKHDREDNSTVLKSCSQNLQSGVKNIEALGHIYNRK